MIQFLIEKYYHISNFTIIKKDNYYILEGNDKVYYLYHFSSVDPIVRAYQLSFIEKNSYQFFFNTFHQLFTFYENNYYVMLLKKIDFSIKNLLTPCFLEKKYRLLWKEEWINTSSYFESLCISEIGVNSLIDESISYYLGMLEIAINYLNDSSNDFYCSFIQRKVFGCENNNPFNYVEDVMERDISEYLKYMFFHDCYNYDDIFALLHDGISFLDYNLLISRLLYPNYYFREVQSILLHHQSDNTLRHVISHIHEFERYVNIIIDEINKYCNIKKYPFS